MNVPAQTLYSVTFNIYLGELKQGSSLYEFESSQASSPWLADVVGDSDTLVYKWSVTDSVNNSARFPITYTMTKGTTVIAKTKNDAQTTEGMTWTASTDGNYELGWKILADKADVNGL